MDFWEVPIPDLIGAKRNPKWHTLRNKHIEDNPSCICCGKIDQQEVHHISPVSIAPELELEPSNLVTMCERCHLVIGHLNDWKKYNPSVVQDSALLLSRH